MTPAQIINKIRKEFLKTIETKNSWGKNEIKAAFETAVSDVCIAVASELIEKEHI